MVRKRTLPWKAGPVSFKRLLGGARTGFRASDGAISTDDADAIIWTTLIEPVLLPQDRVWCHPIPDAPVRVIEVSFAGSSINYDRSWMKIEKLTSDVVIRRQPACCEENAGNKVLVVHSSQSAA
jgi:hypothetical protein